MGFFERKIFLSRFSKDYQTLTLTSILLVLVSAVFHSTWNFYSKKGNWPLEFFFWVFLWGSLLYLPFFVGLTSFPAVLAEAPLRFWYLSFLSGLIQTVYFICLIEAYRVGDLSFVYPISRSAPLFTFFWAILFIGEVVSLKGVLGIGVVLVGIFVISARDFYLIGFPSPSGNFPFQAYFLAFIVALTGSFYSVIDKLVVQMVHPVFCTWLINVWMSLLVGLYLLRRRQGSFRRIWHESRKDIFVIVFLQNIGYGCFLMALITSKVSYVVAFRQVSALFGAVLGVFFLNESHWKTRIAGALILTGGLVLVAWAR